VHDAEQLNQSLVRKIWHPFALLRLFSLTPNSESSSFYPKIVSPGADDDDDLVL
jgi:hypothetical protein